MYTSHFSLREILKEESLAQSQLQFPKARFLRKLLLKKQYLTLGWQTVPHGVGWGDPGTAARVGGLQEQVDFG